jgi:uncharacterized protein YjbI with pentapeptide repeats
MTETCSYTFDPETTKNESSLSEVWSCPHDSYGASEDGHCIFHMDPEQRRKHDINSSDISEAIIPILKKEPPQKRAFIGAEFNMIDVSHADIEGIDQNPTDFRHTTIESFNGERARFEESLDFRHSTIGTLNFDNADFEEGLLCSGCIIGELMLEEASIVGDDANFIDTTFKNRVNIDEATFHNDLSFNDAAFNGKATFRGAKFHGRANSIGNSTSFDGAIFNGKADFSYATMEYTSLVGVTFKKNLIFEKVTANGAVSFSNCTFNGQANFNEANFHDDVSFDNSEFFDVTTFIGAMFDGGSAVLNDDVTFESTTFHKLTQLRKATIGFADFSSCNFESQVDIEEATFTEKSDFSGCEFQGELKSQRTHFESDVDFTGAVFAEKVDFDEVLFNGDGIYKDVTFESDATFRGSEFNGGTNYHREDAVFTNANFRGDVDFSEAVISSGNFTGTTYLRDADFTELTITEELNMKGKSFEETAYFDFTKADLPDGTITLPVEGYPRYDFTLATLGDVTIEPENDDDNRVLLDYVRFCDTTFDGFDFTNHTEYLDRNNWEIHTFKSRYTDDEYALEMTAPIREKTYLNAKRSASDQSNQKAAGEFRVKRQLASKVKHKQIFYDSTESLQTRIANGLRATENAFLGITCGYGLRLYRITGVFIIFPAFAAVVFAFGGPLFETGAGQTTISSVLAGPGLETLAVNVYFSYITFLTIGYGNIGPIGLGARAISAILVYLNVILAGLFLYALIKRNEV